MINLFAFILGSAFPIMMVLTLLMGIRQADLTKKSKSKYSTWLIVGTVLWTFAVWILSYAGIFEYHQGDLAPRFLVGLMLPVLIGVVFFWSPAFLKIIDSTPNFMIVGTQVLRVLGVSFLFVAQEGIGPQAFASAGYGDLATGTLALLAMIMLLRGTNNASWAVWAFNLAGMFDLLNVSRILLTYYPTWYSNEPSTAVAGEFPTVLILCLAAPIALMFHIYSIRMLLISKKRVAPSL